MARVTRLTEANVEIDRLEAEVVLLKKLVLRLTVASVDPDEFEDIETYISEVFGFCEVNSDEPPADQVEIDELTSIVLEAYDFTGDENDDDAAEDGEEDGEDG